MGPLAGLDHGTEPKFESWQPKSNANSGRDISVLAVEHSGSKGSAHLYGSARGAA